MAKFVLNMISSVCLLMMLPMDRTDITEEYNGKAYTHGHFSLVPWHTFTFKSFFSTFRTFALRSFNYLESFKWTIHRHEYSFGSSRIYRVYYTIDTGLIWVRGLNIVAYLLKARTVEPEKQPLLANGSETTFVSRQRPRSGQRNRRLLLGNGPVNVPTARYTHATIEVLLETVFSTRCLQKWL
jgi:hypothetical protein